jgi:hypothetical protein
MPLPFKRDVGDYFLLDGGDGEEIYEGGHRKWEGLASASQQRTMMKVVVRFPHPIPQLTTYHAKQQARRGGDAHLFVLLNAMLLLFYGFDPSRQPHPNRQPLAQRPDRQ